MALITRIKTWVTNEKVLAADLNAEFNNVLDNLGPLKIEDYSGNATQMQITTDPGEVGTESLATTLAGELARLRFMLAEITGKDQWYESPVASLAGLANAIGTGLADNRLVSGRLLSGSSQPGFLIPNGAARTVKLDGTPTSFIYYINGVEYSISTDVTLTGLTAAPSTNNTCLINDSVAADQLWTKYAGEDDSEIPVDTMGSEISALVGKYAAFKLDNGTTTEVFLAYVKSTTSLTKARRGYFFDSADAAGVRISYANNDTITLLKLTWVFAKTDGTLTATYNNPVWSKDEPSSPSVGDYWFDLANNTWKIYSVGSFSSANAILVGVCVQDTTNTIAARSYEFFANYDSVNTVEVVYDSATAVKSRRAGSVISVWGNIIKNEQNLHVWDMTLDRDSGVSESSSTYYFLYLTQAGEVIISDVKPYDRREDLNGYYHPSKSWRCVGRALNNSSSDFSDVESYYRGQDTAPVRAVSSSDNILVLDDTVVFSGASATYYFPPAAESRGKKITTVHDGTTTTQVYTLEGYGSETLDENTSYLLHTKGQSVTWISNGTKWIASAKTQVVRNVGVAYYPVTASTVWTRGAGVMGAFTADTDAPSPTVESNPGPGTIQTTDNNLPQITVNDLPPGVYRVSVFGGGIPSGANSYIAFALYDGTTTTGEQGGCSSLTTITGGFSVIGTFTYTTTGNRTFAVHGRGATGSVNIVLTDHRLHFVIDRLGDN